MLSIEGASVVAPTPTQPGTLHSNYRDEEDQNAKQQKITQTSGLVLRVQRRNPGRDAYKWAECTTSNRTGRAESRRQPMSVRVERHRQRKVAPSTDVVGRRQA